RRSERIRVPLLFLLAGADHIVDTDKSHAFARSLSARNVSVHVYPGFYHEVLREPGHSEPLHDLRDWVASRVPQARQVRGRV
ncbi:MAG: serine aminopeptidase domain-containing protein, partial [Longimicrobiales bacterium]